nr:tetratricopeptide repeat protein [uncultured Rhodopila sp.]
MTYAAYTGRPSKPSPLIATLLGALLLTGCSTSSNKAARNDAETRARLAQLTDGEGNPEAQLARLGEAAARDRSDAALQKRYATALAKAGRNAEALDVALPIYGRDQRDADLGLLIGRLYVRLDNGGAAVPVYQEVVAHDAGNLEALNGLGIAEVMQRSYPDAEATFHQAVAVAPADAASRNNLALALTLEHKSDEAIGILETLWKEDSTSRRVRTNLAMAYVAAGDRDKAAALLSPVMAQADVEKSISSYAQLAGEAQPAPAQVAASVPTRTAGKTRPPGG